MTAISTAVPRLVYWACREMCLVLIRPDSDVPVAAVKDLALDQALRGVSGRIAPLASVTNS